MSTIIKLSQDVTQYYKNITSPISANTRTQRDTIMNSTKALTSYKRKNSRDKQGAWKDRAPDGELLTHDATDAQL